MKTGDANESSLGRDFIGLQNPGSLAGFLEMAFDAVVVFDSQERITYWNPAAEQMYGWTAQGTLGKTPAKLFWPVNNPEEQKSRKQRQSNLKRGETLRGEHNVLRKDGSSLSVKYAIRAIFDGDGKFAGSLAIYRDVSAQEQTSGKSEQRAASPSMEDIWRESGRKFSILFDKASVAAALSEPPEGVLMDVNEAWVKLFGYTRQEAIGKTSLELNMNPDAEGRARLLAQLQERGSAHDIEITLRTKSGETRSFLVNVDLVEIGGQKYILNTAQDITERRQAEAQLERSNQKLHEILASIRDDFYVIDRDWMFVYTNRQFASKLGKEPEDFVGNNVWKMFPKHVRSVLGENFRAAMEKRETRRFEMPGEYTDAWYKITVFPSPEGITVLGSEITEHKRLQAETESMAKFPQENPNPVLRVSQEGVVQFGNRASQKLLDHWNCSIGTPLPAVWREKVTERFRLGVLSEDMLECNGRIFLLQLVPILENHYLNIYGRDITARRRAEEALRESEERYRHLVKHAPTGIYEIDIKTMCFMEVNDSMCQILGYTREELLSMLPEALLDEEGKKQFRKRMAQALTGEAIPNETEYRVRARDGRELWSVLNITINYEDGKPKSVSVIAHDITERKRAEEAIRESQKRYQDLIETTSDFIWEMDSQGKYTYCSPQMEKLWGIKPEDMLGKTPFDAMPPEEREGTQEYFREVISSAAPFTGLTTITLNSQGQLFYVETSGVPFFDQDGRLSGFRGITRDVTEHKRTRQQIFESNQRLLALMNALPVGVSFSDDPSSQHVTGNPAVLAQFEIGSEDNLSASAPDSSAPGRQVQFFRDGKQITDADLPLQRAVAEDREIPPMEFEVSLPSGRRWWALGSGAPIRDQDGNVIGGVAVTQDITESKRREEQLRELSQRLTYHVDNSPLAVIEWGPDMRLVRWSGAAERMFGWKAEEALGRRMEDLQWIYEEDTPQVNDVSADLRTGVNPQRFSANRNYRKDGSVVYCEWYNSSLMDDSGNLRSILSLVLDVSDRKRAEEALLENQEQLQLLNETLEQKVHEKTEEVRRLASDVVQAIQHERHRISHILHDDLQQRIYAIQMQLAFLHDELQNEDAHKEVSEIEQQLAEILAVTRHLSIDLSPPILRDEGLSHAIDWLAAQMRKRYGLSIEFQANEPFAIFDEALHVLLFNCVRELLFNVVKHARASRAVVTLKWVETDLLIEVRDDGKGFLVKALEQQASREENEEDNLQSGFGLTTIRHQLSLFGGYMEIQSEPGAGTRIIMIVPVAENR